MGEKMDTNRDISSSFGDSIGLCICKKKKTTSKVEENESVLCVIFVRSFIVDINSRSL